METPLDLPFLFPVARFLPSGRVFPAALVLPADQITAQVIDLADDGKPVIGCEAYGRGERVEAGHDGQPVPGRQDRLLSLPGIRSRIIVDELNGGLQAPPVIQLGICVLFKQMNCRLGGQILSSDIQDLLQFFDKADLLPCLALPLTVVDIGASGPEPLSLPLGKPDDLLPFFLPLHRDSGGEIRVPDDGQGLLPVVVHAGLQREEILSHRVRFLRIIPAQIPCDLVHEGSLVGFRPQDDLRAHSSVKMEGELPRAGQRDPYIGILVKEHGVHLEHLLYGQRLLFMTGNFHKEVPNLIRRGHRPKFPDRVFGIDGYSFRGAHNFVKASRENRLPLRHIKCLVRLPVINL